MWLGVRGQLEVSVKLEFRVRLEFRLSYWAQWFRIAGSVMVVRMVVCGRLWWWSGPTILSS